jgi:hypothetical protein
MRGGGDPFGLKRRYFFASSGLDPGGHVFVGKPFSQKTRMAGSSPAKTIERRPD